MPESAARCCSAGEAALVQLLQHQVQSCFWQLQQLEIWDCWSLHARRHMCCLVKSLHVPMLCHNSNLYKRMVVRGRGRTGRTSCMDEPLLCRSRSADHQVSQFMLWQVQALTERVDGAFNYLHDCSSEVRPRGAEAACDRPLTRLIWCSREAVRSRGSLLSSGTMKSLNCSSCNSKRGDYLGSHDCVFVAGSTGLSYDVRQSHLGQSCLALMLLSWMRAMFMLLMSTSNAIFASIPRPALHSTGHLFQ